MLMAIPVSNPIIPLRTPEKKRATQNPARVIANEAIEAVLGKKAHDVTVMDMRGVSGVADFFVLCTGDSDLQIKAITDAVEQRIREHCGERPWHIEGYDHLQWVLVDYVDVVVHVFNMEKRAFYGLERLWGDAPIEQVPDDAHAADVQMLKP
jgi:ribosome-associated protein